ncbi:hypothetical protein PAPHI01_1110 [Pancytospora philotis]|nr:hypothetical protein PAPHI01_1110 [Pancytospora philotis]
MASYRSLKSKDADYRLPTECGAALPSSASQTLAPKWSGEDSRYCINKKDFEDATLFKNFVMLVNSSVQTAEKADDVLEKRLYKMMSHHGEPEADKCCRPGGSPCTHSQNPADKRPAGESDSTQNTGIQSTEIENDSGRPAEHERHAGAGKYNCNYNDSRFAQRASQADAAQGPLKDGADFMPYKRRENCANQRSYSLGEFHNEYQDAGSFAGIAEGITSKVYPPSTPLDSSSFYSFDRQKMLHADATRQKLRFKSYDESFDSLLRIKKNAYETTEDGEGFICAYCEARYVYKRCLVNHLLKSHRKIMKLM